MQLGVFALALGVRVWYVVEIRNTPLVRFPVIDSETYLAWARHIAAGNWLGSEAFYQAPLYPYFLACLIRVVGDDGVALRIAQALMSACSCVMIAAAARLLTTRATGIVAGVMLALYPPSIFLCTLIQKTVLDEFGIAVMLLLVAALRQRFRWRLCAGLGLCLGLLAQTRENALLFIPIVAAWFLLPPRELRLVHLQRMACFLGGVSVILGAVAWRNYAVCGELLLTTYQGGSNFYIGNNPDANGSYVALSNGRGQTRYEQADAVRIAEASKGRALSPHEVSLFWYHQAWESIREHPARWGQLIAYKLFLASNHYEVPDSEDQAFYARHSALLGLLVPVWHLGILLPLAIAGIVLSRPLSSELRLILILAAVFLLSVVAFYVLARYRYPLASLLLMFAAAGAVQFRHAWRAGDRRRLTSAAVAGGLAAIPANWPTPFPANAELATSYANAGVTLANFGEVDEAERYLKTALQLEPDKAAAHFGMGQVWLQRRRPAEAIAELETALAKSPDVPHVLAAMGMARLMAHDTAAAIDYLERAVKSDPFDPAAWSNLAEARRRSHEWGAAIDALRRGTEANPDDVELHVRFAWLLATAPDDNVRDGKTAVALAEAAVSTMPAPNAATLDVLAAAYAEAGRMREAVAIAERAVEACGPDQRQAARISARLEQYRAGRAIRSE